MWEAIDVIRKIHTVKQLKEMKGTLHTSIYAEALRVLTILENAYGNTDGGYVAVCDNCFEVSACLAECHADKLLPEWERQLNGGYQSQLYLPGDDYALVLLFPNVKD